MSAYLRSLLADDRFHPELAAWLAAKVDAQKAVGRQHID
jgi:hypothetical protein